MPKLIWKEWHEQSWRLGFGCVVLSAMALIGLRSRIIADETMSMLVYFLGVVMLPVLSSMSLVAAERSDRSLESLLSLPVTPRRILTAKTGMGIVLCAGPLLAAGLLSILYAGGREMTSAAIFWLYARSALAAISLFVWMLALSIRLPNETRAGLLAVGLLILWMMATGGLSSPNVPSLVFAISPLAFIYDYHMVRIGPEANVSGPPLVAILGTQAAICAIVWSWASSRLAGDEGQS